jgi:hypothetical protein
MTKLQVNRQAENEQGVDTATEPKRKQVSKRAFLGPDGAVVETMEEATGARYTLLSCTGGDKHYDVQIGELGKAATWYGIIGCHTKLGNVANSVLNDKEEPGTPDDAGAAIDDFIKQTENGVWAERSTGVAGSRIDKAALAASVVAVATAAGRGGEPGFQYDIVLQKLTENPQYVRAVRQNDAIQREYASRVGKPSKSLDDLASL